MNSVQIQPQPHFHLAFQGGGREANENIPKCAATNFEKLGSRGQCWLEAAFQSYAEQWKAGREPRTQVKGEVSSGRSQPNQVRILWLSHAEGVRVRPACLINLTCREQRPWRVVIPSIVITSITVLHLTAGCGVTVGHVLGLPHEQPLHGRVESATENETRASS